MSTPGDGSLIYIGMAREWTASFSIAAFGDAGEEMRLNIVPALFLCSNNNVLGDGRRFNHVLFNSLIFAVYLPVVFLLYWFVFRGLRWQNAFIVAASYVFYGWWDWKFLILIALTTLCSFLSGIAISRSESRG